MSVSECVRVFPESVAWHVRAQIKERSRRLNRTFLNGRQLSYVLTKEKIMRNGELAA